MQNRLVPSEQDIATAKKKRAAGHREQEIYKVFRQRPCFVIFFEKMSNQ